MHLYLFVNLYAIIIMRKGFPRKFYSTKLLTAGGVYYDKHGNHNQ